LVVYALCKLVAPGIQLPRRDAVTADDLYRSDPRLNALHAVLLPAGPARSLP
jgi:hypothetical protein